MKRKEFCFNADWFALIDDCPVEVQKEVYRAIPLYALKGVIVEMSDEAKRVFEKIKVRLTVRFDFAIDVRYVQIMTDWVQYKAGKRQSYKTQKTLETCYKQLFRYSNGDPELAQEIVNRSICGNLDGLYPIKNYNSANDGRGNNIRADVQQRVMQKLGWQ